MPKKVVYLLGSGATQGVVKHSDNKSLLTRDIQTYIRAKLREVEAPGVSDRIWNEIVAEGRDVEHLITVLDFQYKYETANRARNFYREAIVELAGSVPTPLAPNLYTFLVDLHFNSKLADDEELSCFLSLNYEDLLERSIEEHLPFDIDYGIKVDEAGPMREIKGTIPVLKLHGSFNWENRRPIGLKAMADITDEYALWIPPGVDKRKEHYPFNLLWGKAVEFILEADILRVLGCSLSRNDWGLIPVLYTAQTLSEKRDLRIELIDYTEPVNRVVANYGYLDFVKFIDLEEIQSFKPYGLVPLPPAAAKTYFSEETANNINIFDHWLRAKIEKLYTDNDGVMRDDLFLKSNATLAAQYFTNVSLGHEEN